jgi:hypothetical protein
MTRAQRRGMGATVACLVLLLAAAASFSGAAAEDDYCGPLKLLAMGDSMTKGSINKLKPDEPYALTTKALLQEAVPCFDVETTVAGECCAASPPLLCCSPGALPWDWVRASRGGFRPHHCTPSPSKPHTPPSTPNTTTPLSPRNQTQKRSARRQRHPRAQPGQDDARVCRPGAALQQVGLGDDREWQLAARGGHHLVQNPASSPGAVQPTCFADAACAALYLCTCRTPPHTLTAPTPPPPQMVGINDILLGGRTATEIWEGGLKDLYDEALAQGAHVIGMLPLPNKLVSG